MISILNIGRYISSMPRPPCMTHTFGIVLERGNKKIYILSGYVHKQYKPCDSNQKKHLRLFYQETKGGPNMEQAELIPHTGGEDGQVLFHLTPVGVEHIFPATLAEAKRCFNNLLSAIH